MPRRVGYWNEKKREKRKNITILSMSKVVMHLIVKAAKEPKQPDYTGYNALFDSFHSLAKQHNLTNPGRSSRRSVMQSFSFALSHYDEVKVLFTKVCIEEGVTLEWFKGRGQFKKGGKKENGNVSGEDDINKAIKEEDEEIEDEIEDEIDKDDADEVEDGVEEYEFHQIISKLVNIMKQYPASNDVTCLDIVLKQLLWNASDAIEKSICGSTRASADSSASAEEFVIEVIVNKDDRTLTIVDNGIGMSKPQLVDHFGTLTKMRMKSAVEAMEFTMDNDDIKTHLFGFFSAFLVADRVMVITKHSEDEQYVWESAGGESFTIREDQFEPLGRGTRIVLFLKEDTDYLELDVITSAVDKHSKLIGFPVRCRSEHVEEDEQDIESDTVESVSPLRLDMKRPREDDDEEPEEPGGGGGDTGGGTGSGDGKKPKTEPDVESTSSSA